MIQVLTGPPTPPRGAGSLITQDGRQARDPRIPHHPPREDHPGAGPGLPIYGANRRVPGLRREEVALLAGVSVDYYTRLERGNARASRTPSSTRSPVHSSSTRPNAPTCSTSPAPREPATARARRRPSTQQIRPGIQRILDAMTQAPAFVRNGRLDILAANQLGYALYSTYLTPGRPANTARFAFLDPRSEQFYDDWEHVANEVVAILRSEAGRNPYDRDLTNLIGELSTQSEPFRSKWAAHNVRFHDTGTKRLHHPVVGDLELTYEAMDLSADSGLTLFAYTAEPGSKSKQALQLLGSWAAMSVDAEIRR